MSVITSCGKTDQVESHISVHSLIIPDIEIWLITELKLFDCFSKLALNYLHSVFTASVYLSIM